MEQTKTFKSRPSAPFATIHSNWRPARAALGMAALFALSGVAHGLTTVTGLTYTNVSSGGNSYFSATPALFPVQSLAYGTLSTSPSGQSPSWQIAKLFFRVENETAFFPPAKLNVELAMTWDNWAYPKSGLEGNSRAWATIQNHSDLFAQGMESKAEDDVLSIRIPKTSLGWDNFELNKYFFAGSVPLPRIWSKAIAGASNLHAEGGNDVLVSLVAINENAMGYNFSPSVQLSGERHAYHIRGVQTSASESFLSVPQGTNWDIFTDLPAGSTTLTISYPGMLRQIITVTLASNSHVLASFDAVHGDIDGTNEIDAADVDLVTEAFGLTDSDADFYGKLSDDSDTWLADVDESGEVDAADMDIVLANFGLTGD